MPIPGKATGSINTLSTPLLMLLDCAVLSWIQFYSYLMYMEHRTMPIPGKATWFH